MNPYLFLCYNLIVIFSILIVNGAHLLEVFVERGDMFGRFWSQVGTLCMHFFTIGFFVVAAETVLVRPNRNIQGST